MNLSAEKHAVIDALEAASKGTRCLARDIRENRRTLDGERKYAEYLRDLARVLEVNALEHDESQNPSAPVVELASRLPPRPISPEFELLGDLLSQLGIMVLQFSARYTESYRRLATPEPPEPPSPLSA